MEVMVKQWSYCPKCKGRKGGCLECMSSSGTVFTLIPLSSLPAGIKQEYSGLQRDFIKHQEDENVIGN